MTRHFTLQSIAPLTIINSVVLKPLYSLGDGCHGRGRALHEFMHALGFLHEHQRPDRDEHVKVNFHNVKDGRKDDLKKFDSIAPGNAAYDPYSLMHYGTEAFSKNGKPTLVFKDENVLAGECSVIHANYR